MKGITITCVVLLLCGCGPRPASAASGPPTEPRNSDVTVFQNSAGDKILLSDTALVINSAVIPAQDCSTGSVRCLSYGSKAAFLVPRLCADSGYTNLAAGSLRASVRGASIHTGGVLLSSSASPGFLYEYNPATGVDQIQYDPSGSLADRQQVEEMAFSRRQTFIYRKVNGRTFLACEK